MAKEKEKYSCEFNSPKYFTYCALGGAVSCGLTHWAVTPLDLVKCRMQTEPQKYKSLVEGFEIVIKESGWKGLTLGHTAAALGYSAQGICKFGFYETFKAFYGRIIGEEYSYYWRTSLYLVSSASAEFFADIALCPFEACKVRMQTQPGFATTLRDAWGKIYSAEGPTGLYKGLVPLWSRQIPYTMMKFACFERTVEALYRFVVPKPREKCSKGEQLIVTFLAGYIAGVFCAVVSHPADVTVSKLNQKSGSTALEVAQELGFKGMWKGLGARIIMVGTLTALQWFIYDSVKVILRLPRPPPPEVPASVRNKSVKGSRSMTKEERDRKIQQCREIKAKDREAAAAAAAAAAAKSKAPPAEGSSGGGKKAKAGGGSSSGKNKISKILDRYVTVRFLLIYSYVVSFFCLFITRYARR